METLILLMIKTQERGKRADIVIVTEHTHNAVLNC